MNTKTEGLKPVTPEKLTDSQTMLAEHISRAVAPYLMPLVERGLVLAAIRDALPRRTPIESNTEPVAFKTFTYTRTFNAIAAAVEWKPNHAFGISVAKFIEAFGTVDAPVSVAPAVTDEMVERALSEYLLLLPVTSMAGHALLPRMRAALLSALEFPQ